MNFDGFAVLQGEKKAHKALCTFFSPGGFINQFFSFEGFFSQLSKYAKILPLSKW